jgi:hypothetical protein
MKQVPLTLVLTAICLVAANWPSVQEWSTLNMVHHYLTHGLYLLGGAFLGAQTSRWAHQPANLSLDEAGVSS